MLKFFVLWCGLFLGAHTFAEVELVIVPFDHYKIVTNMILNFAIFEFKTPPCFEFKNFLRMDYGKRNSENIMPKAQVYVAGVFAHDKNCLCEGPIQSREYEDDAYLPFEWEIKHFQISPGY